MDPVRKLELARTAAALLVRERRATGGWMPPAELLEYGSFEASWRAFRALVNTRDALPAPTGFLEVQDELLQGMIAEAGVTRAEDLAPCSVDGRIRLWRGDITTIAADAIVNAANSGMTGCWQPLHGCIDNAIHTFAGVQLRLECARLMEAQGHPEPTGQVKATSAYNLPGKFVFHTVGPIVQNGRPTQRDRELLARCYRSCLAEATRRELHTLVFCCISTGIFGFPQSEASAIAVDVVHEHLTNRDQELKVIFDVFTDADQCIYQSLLAGA